MEENMQKYKSLCAEDRMKYEAAEELGLIDKVIKSGWKSLTSRESGSIGGLVRSKKRQSEK
ncbi:MAG: small, acid-soluble spore protein, alpha/beta type [Tyzzerella sp.]|uniref:Small, acid-soluble spore protein, alpha/beta type n=1 Tax=Candidatus Fimicola merdigallinarum TaxID=2840819 RepID=A0A9D9DV91_9FIRM|nr:small, acid-soluble spore protein, alpha/beta type [Candidatus Fimicola merdigallinarum]